VGINTRKITAGLCGIAVIAGTMVTTIPAANAAGIVAQGVENVIVDSNQQQVIDVFNGINSFRASKGLPPLKFSVPISGISQNWSNTMAANDKFAHNPVYTQGAPDGYTMDSEIIAARNDRLGQGLVTQWIGSIDHNRIMSTAEFNTIGIGIAFTDKTVPQDPFATRYGMYGTANLFRYETMPVQTYNSPADYFAGKPPLTNPITTVTPQAPTFTQYAYVLPAVAGVKYLVNGIESAPGTYPAGTTYEVNIKVIPQTGYTFPQGTVTDYFNFYQQNNPNPTPPPVQQLQNAIPVPPIFNHLDMTYTIQRSEGIQYRANGVDVAIGTFKVPAGAEVPVTITAVAVAGFTIPAGTTTQWTEIFKPVPTNIVVSPPAPTFDSVKRTYTIPVAAGVDYSVNGVKKPAGTYAVGVGGTLSVVATPQPGYLFTGQTVWNYFYLVVQPPAPTPPTPTYAVKAGDLLAVDSAGTLWNYGNRAVAGRKVLASSGWATAKEVFVTDWNADGIQDVVAQWKAGNVTVSYGTTTGTITSAKVIGSGWGTYDISIGKFGRLDKRPTIIAKDTNGNLWQYSNPSGGNIGARVLKGSGWKSFQVSMLDWDKDGNMDIIAKNSAGSLLLYRTDGLGKFKPETRKVIGTGWNGFQMQSITGYTGTNSQGILAKDSRGNLYYYGTGKSAWTPRVSEGAGWLSMNISSS